MRKSVQKMCDAMLLLPDYKSVSSHICIPDLQFDDLLSLLNTVYLSYRLKQKIS
jgi:hypothetical protein